MDTIKKIPEWTKQGPVSRENYDYRVLIHTNLKKRPPGEPLPHLVITELHKTRAMQEYWERYFIDHLGGFPLSYQLFKNGGMYGYTLPEELPQIFDTSYTPPDDVDWKRSCHR